MLANVVRGTGNMFLPATLVVGGAVLVVALAPVLIFGWGPLPPLGVTGAGIAFVANYVLASAVLLVYLRSGRGLVRLSLVGTRLRARPFREILRVGVPGAFNTVMTNLTVVVLTGLVGGFGTMALAGYGLGARLEYLQIPLVFGLGSALVTMVGTNIGAGQHARARRIMWSGAAVATLLTGSIGLTAALAPDLWLSLFSQDPDVLAAGRAYLHIVGPAYGFFGLGLSLYFSSQGLGHLGWPLLAGFARMSVAAVGGWLLVHRLGAGLPGLFAIITLALVVFGTTVAVALWRKAS